MISTKKITRIVLCDATNNCVSRNPNKIKLIVAIVLI